jgi:hypothetical protein
MFNANHDGLDLHLDNAGPKVVTDRTPAISGPIGSSPDFPAVVEQPGPWRPWIVPRSET